MVRVGARFPPALDFNCVTASPVLLGMDEVGSWTLAGYIARAWSVPYEWVAGTGSFREYLVLKDFIHANQRLLLS